MRLIIIRHAEPNYEKDCITKLGHLQAQAAAERLSSEHIEEIFSSPMGRARETAEYTAKRLGFKDIQILDWMHEITWGSRDDREIPCDGHPWNCTDRMVEKNIALADEEWRKNSFFSNNKASDEADRIASQTDEWLLTLGYEREGNYYRCRREDDHQHTLALFCHGGSMSAMIAHIMNLSFPFICATFHIEHTGITTLRFESTCGKLGQPVFETVNDFRHKLGCSLQQDAASSRPQYSIRTHE